MPINLDELQAVYEDGEMQDLTKVAVRKKAASILDEATPSAERIDFAKNALDTPELFATPIWAYMVGVNTDANLDAILRSVGSPSTPTDSTIETNVASAIDVLWP